VTNIIKQILGEDIPGSTDADVTADEFSPVAAVLKFNISVNWEEAGFDAEGSVGGTALSAAFYSRDNLDELLGDVLYGLPNDTDISADIDTNHIADVLHHSTVVIPIEISADASDIVTIKSLLQQRNHGQGWSVSDIRTE